MNRVFRQLTLWKRMFQKDNGIGTATGHGAKTIEVFIARKGNTVGLLIFYWAEKSGSKTNQERQTQDGAAAPHLCRKYCQGAYYMVRYPIRVSIHVRAGVAQS